MQLEKERCTKSIEFCTESSFMMQAGHYISQHESLINHRIIDTRTHMLTDNVMNRSAANTDRYGCFVWWNPFVLRLSTCFVYINHLIYLYSEWFCVQRNARNVHFDIWSLIIFLIPLTIPFFIRDGNFYLWQKNQNYVRKKHYKILIIIKCTWEYIE